MKTALIFGASGLVGSFVLKQLLEDLRYTKVISIGRKKLPFSDLKLEQITGDLFMLDKFESSFTDVDDVFICIGTTQAKTADKETYFAIDYGIPVAAAKMASAHAIKNVAIVSALGADENSRTFYSATKGKMEKSCRELGIENLNFMRPSLIVGPRKEKRFGENLAKVIMTNFGFLVPKKYKAIQAETIAKAMINLLRTPNKKEVWLNHEIEEIVK